MAGECANGRYNSDNDLILLDILFSYEFTENEQAKMYHLSMDCSCQF
jgi:hypothetical protein